MNKFLISIITLFTLFFVNASAEELKDGTEGKSNYKRFYKLYNGYEYDTKNEPMINYNVLANSAVKQMFKGKKTPKTIIVTDFVDLSSLKNKSALGYVLSNSIKDSLINIINANVIESEVSKYFKLSSNGLRLLTRDIKKVKSTDYKVKDAVVGTYTYTKNELIVFVKLINLETGIIKGSYTKSLLIGKDTILSLSYDSK